MNSLLVNLGLQFIIYQYNLVKWRKQDKMSCFFHFFFTECYIFISIIPNRCTKFVMHIFEIKIKELVKAMKVTEMIN